MNNNAPWEGEAEWLEAIPATSVSWSAKHISEAISDLPASAK